MDKQQEQSYKENIKLLPCKCGRAATRNVHHDDFEDAIILYGCNICGTWFTHPDFWNLKQEGTDE